MKQNNILYSIIGCAMLMVSCSQTANNAKITTSAEDDRSPLEFSDADRTFSVVLEISSDSLMTCNNNFSGKDENPLILDTRNPNFPIYSQNGLNQWILSRSTNSKLARNFIYLWETMLRTQL